MMLRRKNDIEAALSPVLFKLNSNNNEARGSTCDFVYMPYLSMVEAWLGSIDAEKLKKDNIKYERMFYIRKKMGKFFDMDRYHHSCKDTDKNVLLLKKRRTCLSIKTINNHKRRKYKDVIKVNIKRTFDKLRRWI